MLAWLLRLFGFKKSQRTIEPLILVLADDF